MKDEPIKIRYASQLGGWIVVGMKKSPIFATRQAAEDYCSSELGQWPIIDGPTTTGHQELPHRSVWTGAPWDHNFENPT